MLMIAMSPRKRPPQPRTLTMLTGFRILDEREYIGPKGERLQLRYLQSDGIPEAEMALNDTLHAIGKLDAWDGVRNAVTSNCCEECGGNKFVQKLIVKNGRVVEIVSCTSGIPVYITADKTKPCEKEHFVNHGVVSGLTPSEHQIRSADSMLFRQIIDERRDKTYDHDSDPDLEGLDDFQGED